MIRVFFGVPESYGNSPGSIWALLGFRGKREERKERVGAAPLLVLFGLEGEGVCVLPWPPLLFSTLGP